MTANPKSSDEKNSTSYCSGFHQRNLECNHESLPATLDGVVLSFEHSDYEPVDLIRFVCKYKPGLSMVVLVEEY